MYSRYLATLQWREDDSCAVGLLRVEEQQVPIATTTVHRRQYRTDRDSVIPIHEMIRKLESQGVVSKARSPFNKPYMASAEVSEGTGPRIQFLGVKWQDGRRQIPTEVINKIIAMSPPTSKKETQAFLGAIGFWRMHIPEYSQIVSPLYLVTRKKNDFHWGPEQQQAFAQIKQEIAHAVALGPVRTGPDVKNVLYSAAGNNGLSWSLWQKVPGETRGRPLGFWSRSYRGSEANYTPTEKEILAAYEGLQAASEVIGTETQLLLAPRLPVLGWMFKGKALTGNGRLQYGAPHDELHKLLKDKVDQVKLQNLKPSS
ncbi:hypothetical protein DUI87_04713 [Hirundo rustica rustica]|uniref:Reverse transcriptase/retrotransposon-derived protein RNase H-like domain-containing protein n=1 Tax=Hirundo rustica rustica TaxID=333673 RepID=A0A3M0LID2_HIRRU|nr:hypothetical protein DUI87_04713 [Hirundo rustica rustica]